MTQSTGRHVSRGTETECRSPAQAFGRRPVAEDERRDGVGGFGLIERLGNHVVGLLADRGPAPWIGLEVPCPVRIGRARRHKEAPVKFLDVADRDGDRRAAEASPGLDADDCPPANQLVADLVGWSGWPAPGTGRVRGRVVRQRPRCCQDLPSVWTEGA